MPAQTTSVAAAEGPTVTQAVRAFSAQAHGKQVLIWWETSRDYEIVFYRCRRGVEAGGQGEVIHDAAAQGSIGIAHYEHVDRPPAPGTYYYTVEEVDFFGDILTYPPVSVFVGRYWVHLPWVARP